MRFPFELLIHAANLLYLFAFMVRDMLWLRILTVIAAPCLIPYFYFHPEPFLTPIYGTSEPLLDRSLVAGAPARETERGRTKAVRACLPDHRRLLAQGSLAPVSA